MKVLPTTPNRLHSINGQTLETNIREEDGKYFLALFDKDSPVAEVPFDPDNPDSSVEAYLKVLNTAVTKIPGRGEKKPAPNPSQAGAVQGKFRRIKFNGQIFLEE